MQLSGRIRQPSLFSQLITYMERFPWLEVMATLTSRVFTKVHGPHGVLSTVGYNSSIFGVSTVEGSTHLTRELPSHVRLGSSATNQCQHLCVEKQWPLNNVGVTGSRKSTSNIQSASLYTVQLLHLHEFNSPRCVTLWYSLLERAHAITI